MVLSENIVTALYIAASVLFILSLGGLSGQESAKRAVWYGIVGMAIAVIGTIFSPGVSDTSMLPPLLIVGAVVGGVADLAAGEERLQRRTMLAIHRKSRSSAKTCKSSIRCHDVPAGCWNRVLCAAGPATPSRCPDFRLVAPVIPRAWPALTHF